jgi:hypothetical protein
LVFSIRHLEERRIGKKCLEWINQILKREGVTINNMNGEFFETSKGLRQRYICHMFFLIW